MPNVQNNLPTPPAQGFGSIALSCAAAAVSACVAGSMLLVMG